MVNRAPISLIKFLIRASLVCFVVLPAFAIDPVTVTVDTNSVNLGQTVNVNFTFTSGGISGFNFPQNTRDYDVVASSSSSNIQVINGKVSQNKSLSYVVQPLHEGAVTIPSVSYNLNNQVFNTQPQTIQVGAAAPRPVPQQVRRRQAAPRPQARTDLNPFVLNVATNYNPYVNQQFLIKTKVYHRGNVRGLNLSALQIDHVNIKRTDQSKEYTEVKDGLEYMVYEVDYVAFPLKSGPITIPQYDVKAAVVSEALTNRGSRMDPFTFMNMLFEENEVVIKAPAININVKPLPTGAPPGFTGYVGSLAVNHQVDKLNINSGEAVTIKTNAYGSGNPKNIEFEFFEKSQLYSVYKDKENLNKEINKGYEYFGLNASAAIIPERKSGRITIKTKPLISFNPYTKQYETHGADAFEIFVKPSAQGDSNGQAIDDEAEQDAEAKMTKEEFKKEVSLFSMSELVRYKSWKNFDPSYLIIMLFILNIVYFTRFTLRRVKFGTGEEKLSYKDLTDRVKKATELEEVSSIIKDLQKDLADNEELKSKFSNFTAETDKYNYGFAKDFDEHTLKALKEKAVELIKELRVNA